MQRLGISVIAILFSTLFTTHAANLKRGPYLQKGTTTEVTVRWRTDTPTNSVVKYGTSMSSLNKTATDNTSTTEHIVTITGLSPDTKYFYSVGSSSETHAAAESGQFFRTHPPVGTVKPIRVWVIGDSGTSNAAARDVSKAYYNYTGAKETNVWLMLGDNAYTVGSDSQYQSAVFNMYKPLLKKTFLWPAIGNHDVRADGGKTYNNIFTLPTKGESGGRPSGTEKYYSFDYGNVHFVCIDSQSSGKTRGGAMGRWLSNDLANTNQTWKVVYWHHPPYSFGSHNSDNEGSLRSMRSNFVPICEDYGVDIVFSGHSHSYERSFLMNGHYGNSGTLKPSMILDGSRGREDDGGAYKKAKGPHQGTIYCVAGMSGKTSGGSLQHPVMVANLRITGSVVLDFNGNRMDARFLNRSGERRDYYTLIKGGGSTPPPNPVPEPNPEPVPSPVPDVSTGAKELVGMRTGPTTIELSWKAPDGNPALKEYGIVLGKSSSTWKRIKTVSGTTLKTILTSEDGIKAETALLQVRAVKQDGTKLEMSSQISVAPYSDVPDSPEPSPTPTPEPAPTPVPTPAPEPGPDPVGNGAHGLAGIRTALTNINLSWKAPVSGVAVSEYRIVLGSNNKVWKRVKVVSGSTLSTTLTSSNGITADTALLQVRAIRASDGSRLDMSEQLSVAPFSGTVEPSPTPAPVEPTPTPAPEPTPPPSGDGTRYEAEDATVVGAKVVNNYVDYVNARNDYIEWTVSASGGNHTLGFIYALSSGDRPLQIMVNGTIVAESLSFPASGSWSTWTTVFVQAQLQNGTNKIRATAIGKSGGNVDALTVTPADGGEPTPTPEPAPTPVPTPAPNPAPEPSPAPDGDPVVLEAEDATVVGAKVVKNYVDYVNARNDYIEWTVNSSAGPHKLDIRYALAYGERPLELSVNGNVINPSLDFPITGSWSTYGIVSVQVQLNSGTNKIRLTAIGKSGGNIDSLTVTPL